MKKKTNTFNSVEIDVTVVDQGKINELMMKRDELVFDYDVMKKEFMKKGYDNMEKIVKIDNEIRKLRKGKIIKRKITKRGK